MVARRLMTSGGLPELESVPVGIGGPAEAAELLLLDPK
jgi:hypothetical protein